MYFSWYPLRNALIVKEHQTLLYPEGTACADVLLAGEEGGANASTVFSGMGLAAVFKFIVDGLKVIPADVSAAFKSFKGEIGMEVYPALLGVGLYCRTKDRILHVCWFCIRMAGYHPADLSVRT